MGNAIFVTSSVGGTVTSATQFDNTVTLNATNDLTAKAGTDLTITMGDAAGSNKIVYKNSSGTTVSDVTSTGVYTLYD